MSIIDKLTGRAKKAAGDLTDDASLRREGRKEERKGEAKDELAQAQERADDQASEVADLQPRTWRRLRPGLAQRRADRAMHRARRQAGAAQQRAELVRRALPPLLALRE